MKLNRHRTTTSATRGLSLVEVLIVMLILTLSLGEVSRSLITVSKLEPLNRESDRALMATTSLLAEMRSTAFDTLVSRYNTDPADDPAGPGTAPGAAFAITGLNVQQNDPDGFVGRIEFPGAAGELREDFVDPELGTPRDLNGDGAVDALDHRGDYIILPVRISVDWLGVSGPRSTTVTTLLTSQS